MKISFQEVNKILATLPISYYLKSKASVLLSEDEELSSIDLITKNIIISYPQIQNLKCKKSETGIRTCLYHEVGHAILTPRPFKITIDKKIYNIFEDEREETILTNYFIGVKFKEVLVENYKNMKIKTPLDKFFYCVRLRGGGDEINDLINQVIVKWKYLKYSYEPQLLDDYQNDIMKIYFYIVRAFNPSEEEVKEYLSSCSIQSLEVMTPDEVSESITSVFATLPSFENKSFSTKIKSLLLSRKTKLSNNASSKRTYTGKLVPKSVNNPNTEYKWHTKKGDGFLKYHQKLKINLFIDQSGSFKKDEAIVNSMLKTLVQLERQIDDFEFTLTTIDTTITTKTRYSKYIDCKGGNCLSPELFKVFKKLQDPKCKVINIVLLDGDIATDTLVYEGQAYKAFSEFQVQNLKAFNTKNTLIISDFSNKKYLDKYCLLPKKRYTYDYTKELEKNILTILKIFL